MNWRDSPEEAAFREEVRTFIRERFPESYVPDLDEEQSLEPEDVLGYNWAADRKSANNRRREGALEWARALAGKGWIAPHWPQEYGGAGLNIMEHFILQEEMMRAQAPTVNGIGVFLLGPTLLAHGTEEQRRRHLPKISAGETAWAQGFSEPEAGSDLAALQTRAVRDGDCYVVNGQKTWTSQAQYADWLFALVRTDPEARKHRGITFVLIDMNSPGVTVRPIKDMRGDKPFAEVFFNDVRVPMAHRVGEENKGWYIAMATLGFERSGIGACIKYEQVLARLVALLRSETGGADHGRWKHLRHEIAQRYIEVRVLYNLALQNVSQQAAGKEPGYESSINQLFSSELHQRLARTCAKTLGARGTVLRGAGAPAAGAFARDYLSSVAATFLAGASEIQRNIIAIRGLELPRE